MGYQERYRDLGTSLAILEIIYRGLYADLMRDDALKSSLVLFLPYFVMYHATGHRVILIHPQQLGISPSRRDAQSFFEDEHNKRIIEKAINTAAGRDDLSSASEVVTQINKQPSPGARISVYTGREQYRNIVARNEDAGITQAANEYKIDSCPHLYPALGVICQKKMAK